MSYWKVIEVFFVRIIFDWNLLLRKWLWKKESYRLSDIIEEKRVDNSMYKLQIIYYLLRSVSAKSRKINFKPKSKFPKWEIATETGGKESSPICGMSGKSVAEKRRGIVQKYRENHFQLFHCGMTAV